MAIAARRDVPQPSLCTAMDAALGLLNGVYGAVVLALRPLRSIDCAGAVDRCARNRLRIGAAAIGMFGLGVQLASEVGSTVNIFEATCRFLCYFTFWTNAIAALSMLIPVLAPSGPLGSFLSRPAVRTVIAANLLVVGVVYHCFLSEPFEPTWGYQADLYLHYITPALYLADWCFRVPHTRLAWRTALRAVAVPLPYGIWMMGYGAITQWYPYPFIEVQTLGAVETVLNLFCLSCVFMIAAAMLVLVDRLAHRIVQ